MRGTVARANALLLVALVLSSCQSTKNPANQAPTNPVLQDLLDYRNGVAMIHDGRIDEAIVLLRRARAVNPLEPGIPNALGLALLYKRDFPMAIAMFNEALRLDSNYVEALNNRGVAYMETARLDDAEKDFRTVTGAMAPATEKRSAYYNLGMIHNRKQEWMEAEAEFTFAIREDARHLDAYRERGLARSKRENFGAALEDFIFVLREEPKNVVANYQAALCLLAQGRRDLATRYMERAVTAGPETEEGKRAKRFLANETYLMEKK